ncbi:DUF5060 domain-containing protein [Reichenbachiella agarivorans]|uniref:DUF5060 domain-containing protein n=1 Tax=Reichenbachiella agarivorans TaxID=2979464 RepID=A0ABY6CR00_9BACT|nr:DUF5060 domain-containing protein [Reichenbachiella agarivorans]UXP31883.1 DUF5060 domain-containing protein [Reichenbachiella agarivorans]
MKSRMKDTLLIWLLTLIMLPGYATEIDGELKQWHTITLTFEGPTTSEYDTLNPFLNYRLQTTFTQGEQQITVPGYFAADGKASETSARAGNKWQVKFVPNLPGEWLYEVSFRQGKNIAISDKLETGKGIAFDGESGKFEVIASDKSGRDFRSKGRLTKGAGHYPIFSGSKEVFVKGGTNSPEDLLAYYEFDGTPPKHHYANHVNSYRHGDVTWQQGKGKNLIGAMNYLSDKGINAVYFLTMNVMGDGKNVWPWTEEHERYRFDVSKLAQWELVFSHMDEVGLAQHLITQETENENLLDIGYVGIQRKLYYREMIARFGHHLGLIWNMGEENGITHWSPVGQTEKMREEMINYFRSVEPYGNLLVIHTLPDLKDHERTMTPLLGNEALDGVSFQIHHQHDSYHVTTQWREKSAEAGYPWIIWIDEIGPAKVGAWSDDRPAQQDSVRKEVIYPNLIGGGAGIEHYFGYKQKHSDLTSEDWTVRDRLWTMTAHAIQYFDKLPLEQMLPVSQTSTGYCLAQAGERYVVYIPEFGEELTLDLTQTEGKYSVHWFDPVTGKDELKGSVRRIKGGAKVSLGSPPIGYPAGQDWVVRVE